MNKSVVGYIRVSGKSSVDGGLSLERQQELISQYCQFKNLGEPIFLKDEAKSGFYSNRRESFQELLQMIQDQKVSHVIVNDLSRLSRNVRLTLETVELMQKNEVTFISLSEDISTNSAMGRCFLTICSAFAQQMRDQTSEKMISMYEQNRKSAKPSPGFEPFGLTKENDQLKINQGECQILKNIFDLRDHGMSYRAIAEKLQTEGAVTKRSGKWRASTIRSICQVSKKHPFLLKQLELLRA